MDHQQNNFLGCCSLRNAARTGAVGDLVDITSSEQLLSYWQLDNGDWDVSNKDGFHRGHC